MKKRNKNKEKNTEEQVKTAMEETKSTEEKETIEEEVKEEEGSEIEEMQAKYDELNDKYLRLYSDFDNFRKRTIKEKGDLINNASAGVLKDILPIIDDFERAIENNEDSTDAESIKEGFQLIYSKMMTTLKTKGLKEMESKGEPFDYDHHEAVTNIPAQEEDDKGKVMDVIQKGYYLNDKVIRYAKVVVGN